MAYLAPWPGSQVEMDIGGAIAGFVFMALFLLTGVALLILLVKQIPNQPLILMALDGRLHERITKITLMVAQVKGGRPAYNLIFRTASGKQEALRVTPKNMDIILDYLKKHLPAFEDMRV